MGDIILAVIVAAIVFFAARSVFVKKSGGCGGDCATAAAAALTIRRLTKVNRMKRAGSSNELPALFAFAGQMLFLYENALFLSVTHG